MTKETLKWKKGRQTAGSKEQKAFPSSHSNIEQSTVAYTNSIIDLINDRNAYFEMFKDKFEESKAEDRRPIDYHFDYQLGNEDSKERIYKLLKILSHSKNMTYFRSKFIQRMITTEWNG